MITTKVDKMGRTVVPSAIRKILGIKEGDQLEWSVEGGKVVVRKRMPVDKSAIRKRFEKLKKKAPECFTEKVDENEDEDKWGLKEWALTKLGL